MSIKYILSSFMCLIIFSASAQQITYPKDLKKKCFKKYEQARQAHRENRFDAAQKAYRQVLKKNPQFAAGKINLARLAYDTGQKKEAKNRFASVIAEFPEYDPKVYLAYGSLLMELEEYNEASRAFEEYLNRDPDHKKAKLMMDKANILAKALNNPVSFEPVPLSELVNTIHLEYEASFTADESQMIFTRNFNNQEDLFVATLRNGEIIDVQAIDELNTPMNEGAHCISPDGTELIFTLCDNRRTVGGCDLYSSSLEGKIWSKPKNLGRSFNSEATDSQPSLSGDGNTLYFTSSRKGGFGKNDIWYAIKGENGQWSIPQNMGADINTAGDDETAFIHKDGLTLYFASDGRAGLGNLDLYLARRDSWSATWDTIEHLPYPINTIYDDRGLKVSLDGKTAYFSTDRNEGNLLDLYSFTLPKSIQPHKSTYLKLIVVDAETNSPIPASLELTLLNNKGSKLSKQADQNGKLVVSYPADKSMSVHISHPNYIFFSDHIAASRVGTKTDPLEYEVRLRKTSPDQLLTKSKAIVLNNIFFETGSSILDPRSEIEIHYLYQLLIKNPELQILILGHTDSVGDDSDNLILSTQRAKSVFQALIEKGISAARLSYEGKGEAEPIQTNDTDEGRQANRRTEFVVVKN